MNQGMIGVHVTIVGRFWKKPSGVVISTKAEGRAEKSACEQEAPSFRGQMSRLRWRSARRDKLGKISVLPANMTRTRMIAWHYIPESLPIRLR
jgi:hypothetical protein